MRILKTIIAMVFVLSAVSACTTVRFSPTYVPTSTEEVDSRIQVNDFAYHPKAGVKQNEIRETAAGFVYFTEPVGQFVANAVRREFPQSGISLTEKAACYLDGDVKDFTIDSLGFSVNWITDFRYVLKSKSDNAVLIDRSYKVKFNTSKFVVAPVFLANLNRVVSQNIKKLLTDEKFVAVAQSRCKKTS